MMKEHKFLLLTLVILAIGTFLFFGKKNTNTRLSQNQEVDPETRPNQTALVASVRHGESTQNRLTASSPLLSKTSTISESDLSTLRSNLPDKEKVNEEVSANPHRTPESLTNFAKSMAPLMEKARNDDKNAKVLVDELSNCALDESAAHAARALCVTNSEDLARTHTQLESKVNDLRSNVSPEVRSLLERRNLLIKQ